MHVPTCYELLDGFLELYKKDFENTGGGLMERFLGMEVEQPCKVIRLHLDSYIQEVLTEYKAYIKKALHLKTVLVSPGLVLANEDCPITPDPSKQKYYRLFIGFTLILPLQYQRLHASVHLQVHSIGRYFIIWWSTSKASQASSSPTADTLG